MKRIIFWNKEEFGNIFQEKNELATHMEQVKKTMIWEGRLEQLIEEET